MPRVLRRAKQRREIYTARHVEFLERGYCLFDRKLFKGRHEANVRRGWFDLRDEILPAWTATRPYTRPWAWWRYEAPERRRAVNRVHPFDCPAWLKETEGIRNRFDLDFGMPRFVCCAAQCGVRYESEAAYLRRLSLLEPSEHGNDAALACAGSDCD